VYESAIISVSFLSFLQQFAIKQ